MKKFEVTWIKIVKKLALTFRFTPYEREILQNNNVAKLIGAIPFLAGCESPCRTAVSHVSIYLIAKHPVMRDIYDHQPGDDFDIINRLFDIKHFRGGKKKIIQRGMELLMLTMLSNYQKDQTADELMGKYNPIYAKKWNYEPTRKLLTERIKSVRCPEMDEIFGIDDGTEGWWDPFKENSGIPSENNNFHRN